MVDELEMNSLQPKYHQILTNSKGNMKDLEGFRGSNKV
jgi:hypothetical protein